jgi:cysteine-rich repeat protein
MRSLRSVLLVLLTLATACGDCESPPSVDTSDAGPDADASMDTDAAVTPDANMPCGNGTLDDAETCDDGNAITERCAYGESSCTVCDATCNTVAGAIAFCGDGVVDLADGEQCEGESALCDAECMLTCADAGAEYAGLLSTGCYLYFATERTRDDAETACVDIGGHLVAYERDAEWTTVSRDLADNDVSSGFIGLSLDENGVGTAWTNGAAFDPDAVDLDVETDEASGDCTAGNDESWWRAECLDARGYLCELGTCGDGVVFANEECDDANAVAADGCDPNCRLTGCGNGVVTAGEDCDDGNLVDGDGCDATCLFPCGSGLGADRAVRTSRGCTLFFDEAATHDEAEATCAGAGARLPDIASAAEHDAFIALARESSAFWGVMWLGLDDVETEDTFVWDSGLPLDYTKWATGQPFAGPNVFDCVSISSWGGWLNVGCTSSYPFACEIETCGNGILDGEDACDDGNLVSGDGCDRTCMLTGCGSGVITEGEDCDDGNTADGDTCPSTCVFPCGQGSGADAAYLTPLGCHMRFDRPLSFSAARTSCESVSASLVRIDDTYENGFVRALATAGSGIWIGLSDEASEGMFVWTDGTPATFLGFTGNEPNDTTHSENCGELTAGGGWNDLSCNGTRPYVCEIATCGNGVLDANEDCDEADAVNGDGCDVNCSFSVCGNGIRTGLEACDDGNLVDGDGCESDCTFVCGAGAPSGVTAAFAAEGRCYEKLSTSLAWADAEAACVVIGAHLVAITSEAERDRVLGYGAGDHYLGLNDEALEGSFVWSSGEAVTYTAWAVGEPNNSNNEDCATMNAEGGWNDLRCTEQRRPFCESALP